MWCDHCPESELAVTPFAISVIKADYCERFCVHIRVIVSWEEWENMICFRFILSVTWLGNLELARRWRACVPKTPTHCTVPPLLTAVAQPNTHTHRRDDSAPCVVAWLRRSSVCIKVTESYHRYYMTPWKQYVLPLCPRLIFEHTRRHRQQSALVAYWFIVEWVSVFSIHHSVARQHVYVSILARVCVSVCLSVSVWDHVGVCIPWNEMLFQAWSHPVHRLPVGGQWATKLSCIAEKETGCIILCFAKTMLSKVAIYQHNLTVD